MLHGDTIYNWTSTSFDSGMEIRDGFENVVEVGKTSFRYFKIINENAFFFYSKSLCGAQAIKIVNI